MAEKRYLFTPGPTPVPPEVLAAMAEPIIHHRGPTSALVYERCLARLQEVFRTENDVLLFASSGTGGDGVGRREPLLARRPGARRVRRLLRRALGGDRRARTAATSTALRLRVGRSAGAGRPRRARSPSARRVSSADALRDVDGRRRRRAGARGRGDARRARSRSSTRSRASAPSRSRPTPGASTSSSRARRRR